MKAFYKQEWGQLKKMKGLFQACSPSLSGGGRRLSHAHHLASADQKNYRLIVLKFHS